MGRRHIQKLTRRWHRRLGVVIGIQFLFWTLGGFYFSWFNIDNVRGEYERKIQDPPNLKQLSGLLSVDEILKKATSDTVYEIQIARFMDRPVYRLIKNKDEVEMFDARTGEKISPISREQARKIARQDFALPSEIVGIQLVTVKGGEYKGPIPAYRVSFDNWKNTNVYVHANTGVVTARRNSIWRGFDFLWMFHILDFKNRQNFNNWVLRILSVFGLITLFSGYLLWGVTTPLLRRKRKKKASEPVLKE